jgi:sugar lactone lactonase YvrE
MKTLQSRVVVDGIVYPEGIRWYQDKVWFSDTLDLKVLTYDPKTHRTEVVLKTDDRPSGLGFLPDGRLLLTTMGELKLWRLDPDGLKVVADLKSMGQSLNDMVVDPQGRAYLDVYLPGAEYRDGCIVMVEPSGAYRIVADDLRLPNGLAVTPDGKTLVVAEFVANRVIAFDIAADGSLSNQRVFADLGADSPDGLCLDAEGAAWVGLPFQNKFRRIKPGGEVTHEIAYAKKWGVAPVLGGSDRRSLFLCTTDVTLENLGKLMHDPRDARKECKGWIEVVEGIEVPGVGWP